LGLEDYITLGNLDAQRDWGYAPDYVEAMWMMLQHDAPDDYIIATGKSYSVRYFLDKAFECVGILDWSKYVRQDEKFLRPAEVDQLVGDPFKAQRVLGWTPKVSLEEMIKRMVKNDIKLLEGK